MMLQIFLEDKLSRTGFTLAWTLHELTAPAQVNFYDVSWDLIGTRDTLSQSLSQITGISQKVLLASKDQRMQKTLDECG